MHLRVGSQLDIGRSEDLGGGCRDSVKPYFGQGRVCGCEDVFCSEDSVLRGRGQPQDLSRVVAV